MQKQKLSPYGFQAADNCTFGPDGYAGMHWISSWMTEHCQKIARSGKGERRPLPCSGILQANNNKVPFSKYGQIDIIVYGIPMNIANRLLSINHKFDAVMSHLCFCHFWTLEYLKMITKEMSSLKDPPNTRRLF